MAASQNPIQGSLFGENDKSNIVETEQTNASQALNEIVYAGAEENTAKL